MRVFTQEENERRIRELLLEKSKLQSFVDQRVAMRTELEELLGYRRGVTYEVVEFDKAVKRLRNLADFHKKYCKSVKRCLVCGRR